MAFPTGRLSQGSVMLAELLSSNKEVVIRLSQLSLAFLGDLAVPRRS